jgi:uncharacterized protein YndB with AHSA1/START domain
MDTVIIEQTLDAQLSAVWSALTDKERLRQWFFEVTDFEPRKGFAFSFPGIGHDGAEFVHLCEVLEVKPLSKIKFSWEYAGVKGYSTVSFELFPEDDGRKTRLRLFHDGIDTFPQNEFDFSSDGFGAGWTEIITRMLPAYLNSNQ